jgi:hypothetical protein
MRSFSLKVVIFAVWFYVLDMVHIHAQEVVKKYQEHDTVCIMQMNSFTNIPEEIDGCSCFFSVSQEELKKGCYIFVNDFASLAFVKIQGELKRFELQNHDEEYNAYYYLCNEDTMEVKILNKITCEDGSELMEGIITIKMKNDTIKQKYVGKCDC